jgi:type I restriction enzyme, S subunit
VTDGLPAGWRLVRLGEVAESCLGKMLDARKNKGRPLPYLRNPNVKWFRVDLSDLKEMPFEDRELDRYGLRYGDVLVCEGGEAGRAAIWENGREDVKFQKAIHRVRPGKELFNRYLVYRLMFDYHSGRLADYYTGTTIIHLTGQDLAKYRFPLPPLTEQRRIAGILDKAEALRAKRRAALAKIDILPQVILLELFGDPATNPKGWAKLPLKNCTSQIQIGPFGSLLHQEDYVASGIPLVNPKHIQNGTIVPNASESVTARKFGELATYHLCAGDVVMGRRGEMGRCAIVEARHLPLLCGTGSLLIRPDEKQTSSLFLCALLASEPVKKNFERLSLGQTLPNLNSRIVEQFTIPLPPIQLQREFACRVEAVEKLKATQRASLAKLDALFASLQHRAFRGEL